MFKTCCGDCGECWYVGNPRTCTCPDETTQRTWVGLTHEEVDEIYTSVQEEVNKHWDKGGTTMFFPFTLYKALEQALKEKNT